MTADLAMMPAWQLVKLFKARKASPVEAAKAAIARIDAFNPQLNAFQHLDPDGALRAARASEKRWKKGGKRLSDIDGVPITIKDMVLTKGMPTWGPVLGAKKISEVTAYILSKHQEGEPVVITPPTP